MRYKDIRSLKRGTVLKSSFLTEHGLAYDVEVYWIYEGVSKFNKYSVDGIVLYLNTEHPTPTRLVGDRFTVFIEDIIDCTIIMGLM